MLSPYYQRADEADTEATPEKREPPVWLSPLRQPTWKPSPPPQWLGLACRWGRPHFVCCHWSWKSIQTGGQPRQVRLLSRSSGNYHTLLVTAITTATIVMTEEPKGIFSRCSSVAIVLSVTFHSQTKVIWEVLGQDVILYQNISFESFYTFSISGCYFFHHVNFLTSRVDVKVHMPFNPV